MISTNHLAAILGCAGPRLKSHERAFFRDADPLGFILFARNIRTPDQVRRLIDELRACVGRADAPILIDQEGGRVQRLGSPHWRKAPPAARIAALERANPEAGRETAALNTALLALELADLGITVDCVPVLDIPHPGADPVIGDRAVGTTPEQSTALGSIICRHMLSNRITPVIKHLPGHGRANVDSHHALPVVNARHDELREVDFAPFSRVAELFGRSIWGMTAHVVYTAVDARSPATTSERVIGDVIRRDIGFDGFLVSDDLGMQALGGTMAARADAAMRAGCDTVLHCSGNFREMTTVAARAGKLSRVAAERYQAAEAARMKAAPGLPGDTCTASDERVRHLLGKYAA